MSVDLNHLNTYESDVNYSINGARLLAIVIGLWPVNSQKSSVKTTIKFFVNFISSVLMLLVILSNILCAIYEMENTHEIVEISGSTSFYITTLLKYLLLVYRSQSIGKCMKLLKDDWKLIDTAKKRDLMLKNSKLANYISIFSMFFMFGGGLGHHFFRPLLSENIITEMNISVKPFPSPVFGKILNTGYSPVHECVFCAVVTADMFFISTATVSFNLPAILILHACGQFEIIILYLNDLVIGLKEDKNTAQERFVIIIKNHLRVLSYVSQLEKLFNGLFLVEMMGSSINLCLLGYYVIESLKDGNIGYSINFGILFMGFLFVIFVYCYVGELLTNQADKVGDKGYMIDWHNLPNNLSQDLLFFIRICQLPAKISAGKVVFLSMATFTTIMKSSMAYFNVIWKMG